MATYTYDPAEPTQKDRVRSAIRDTGPNDWFIADETINARLADFGYNEGAAQIAEMLAVEFSTYPDKISEVGGTSEEWKSRSEVLFKMASILRNQPKTTPKKFGTRVGVIASPKTPSSEGNKGIR